MRDTNSGTSPLDGDETAESDAESHPGSPLSCGSDNLVVGREFSLLRPGLTGTSIGIHRLQIDSPAIDDCLIGMYYLG